RGTGDGDRIIGGAAADERAAAVAAGTGIDAAVRARLARRLVQRRAQRRACDAGAIRSGLAGRIVTADEAGPAAARRAGADRAVAARSTGGLAQLPAGH